jgi:hypothetical protein
MKPPLLTLAALFTTLGLGSARADERPNVLFLFADDRRYDTLGCAGYPIVQTPTLDRLAALGVRFSNGIPG